MATPPTHAAEFWRRVTQLTADALDRPTADRAAWLAAQCGGDDGLRREVESLLAADARAGQFLEAPALASHGAADVVTVAARESLGLVAGRRIGPYEIIRELGHGGMGVVYLAARADRAFEKQVAIKVIRAGASTEIVLQRFESERRILATLDHPHIARLLDGGATPDGLSYFVMEYVEGVPLDAHCEAVGLSLRQRLELFRHVCAAVQYAHQHLVIHRDLKPRNILVTAEGTPKLLDFGIAKLLDSSGTAGQTLADQRAFTVEYASPEQIRGEPMAVTSDVYALGVLVYQLIAGTRPCGASATADTELMRAICDESPVRPGVAARGASGFDVPVELEWIVLKALRKEPERRYESVERLIDDLDRLASARPVLAGPDTRRYRGRKFVSRHRTAVAAGALLALSLLGGMAATLWQARRADEQRARAELRFQNVRRLANAMVFELNDALEEGVTSARALLLRRASEQLDALAVDSPDDPVLVEELATAYHRLGNVLGAAGSANLGDAAGGLAQHRKGLALRRAAADRAPEDVEARARLATSLTTTSYAEDQVQHALDDARDAVDVAQRLPGAGEMRFRRIEAAAQYALGSHRIRVGEMAAALDSFEQAAALYERAYAADPADAELRRSVALCHKRLGAILAEREPVKALPHMRRAIELDELGVADTPHAPQRRRDLSVSNIQLGFALQTTGDPIGARSAYGRALGLREELMREDPKNAQAVRDVASALWYIGNLENSTGHPQAAIAALQRAVPLSVPPASAIASISALVTSGLADAYVNLGQLDNAIRMRRQAIDQYQRLSAAQPKIVSLQRSVVREQSVLATTLMRLADRTTDPSGRVARRREACAAFDEGLRLSAALGDAAPAGSDAAAQLDELRRGRARCR